MEFKILFRFVHRHSGLNSGREILLDSTGSHRSTGDPALTTSNLSGIICQAKHTNIVIYVFYHIQFLPVCAVYNFT